MEQQQHAKEKAAFLAGLETIKELSSDHLEAYTVVKEQETGQHYLRYSIHHIRLAEGGREEDYEHFLPLTHDELLAIVVGDTPYQFPDHWRAPYFRSGTDDRLLWFDPRENYELSADAAAELAVWDKLQDYKRDWENATDREELTRQFMAQIDGLLKKADDQ